MLIQRIVVIDDDLDVGMLVDAVAQTHGIACTVTSNASVFMAALEPETTLVFVDLMMPGVDGIEILRALAARNCRSGIVMMSGVGKRVIESADTLGRSLGLNMIGHLTKPFRVSEIEAFMESRPEPEALLPHRETREFIIEESDLLLAVERDEFVLHYQPQIEIASGRVVGVEGLVRWEHPKLGLVFPDSFIEIAEDVGLMDRLTELVFHHGLSEISLFNGAGEDRVKLSLNVSVSSLRDLEFPDRFIGIVNEYGFRPDDMILEITEGGLIRALSRTLDVMTRLRLKGVQLSVDDFGTGYSMMQQLRLVPATEMKIDKSIVQKLHTDNDRVILQKTIELGHELGMKVVAEGVETEAQLEFLREKRCDMAQGYLFSRPIPSEKLVQWLEAYRRHGSLLAREH